MLIDKNQHLSLNFTQSFFDFKREMGNTCSINPINTEEYLSIEAFPQNEDFHLLIRQHDNIFHRLGFKSKWHINGLLALAIIGGGLLKYYGEENRFLSSEVHRYYSQIKVLIQKADANEMVIANHQRSINALISALRNHKVMS